MNTNDIFSFTRFLNFAKRELSENRRMLLLQFGSFFGVVTIMGFFFCYGLYTSNYVLTHEVAGDPWLCVGNGIFFERHWIRMWFVMAVVMFGSLAVWNMDSKAKRISRIMSPASQQEKFLFGACMALVVMPLISLLAIEAFDVLRVIAFGYAIDTPCRDLVGFMNVPMAILDDVRPLGFAIGVLSAQSVFVLGSSIWHRKPLIKTIIAIVLVIFAFMMAHVIIGPVNIGFEVGETSGMIINAAIVVVNWGLSYYLFTRANVVGRIINRR